MNKKFFAGLTVLLGVSLFVLGCDPGNGPDGGIQVSSETALNPGQATTIRGVTVVWDSPAKTGATFATAVEGTVNIPVGAAKGTDTFPNPAGSTVIATIVDNELTDEDAFNAAAINLETLVADMEDLVSSDPLSEGTQYLYLKIIAEDLITVTWYKITVTVSTVAEATNFPKSATFRVVQVQGSNALLSVDGENDPTEGWYAIPDNSNVDAILKAIYEPNKPGAAPDGMGLDGNKAAVSYTAALSAEVLKLFTVTTGDSGAIENIEVTGTELPDRGTYGASTSKLIVIDIGKPDEDNSDTFEDVVFHIPDRKLGTEQGTYGHIRLRVNEGAELVILADNTNYLASSGSNSCPDGYFNGGCVEVMAGGKLRDGAYEGFPLGSNAVILNRYNSYLSVGPEESHADAYVNKNMDSGLSNTYKLYYQGYLLAPTGLEGTNLPRIEWDSASSSGNTNSSYLEVRPGEIATNGIFTVKKSLGLIYSVWFVGNASITIDVAAGKGWGSNPEQCGLFSNESATNNDSDYRFYANTTNTVITIASGSMFDKRYLLDGVKAVEASDIIAASTGPITIAGTTTGDKAEYADGTGIFGYFIPLPEEENDD